MTLTCRKLSPEMSFSVRMSSGFLKIEHTGNEFGKIVHIVRKIAVTSKIFVYLKNSTALNP